MHNKGDNFHQEKPYYLKAQTLEGERGIGNAHTLYMTSLHLIHVNVVWEFSIRVCGFFVSYNNLWLVSEFH